MAPRSTFACILVLATLALPGAVAQDPVTPIVADAVATVNAIGAEVNAMLPWAPEPEPESPPAEPEAAPEEHSHAHDDSHGDAEPRAAPSDESSTPTGTLLAPVRGLVPIPDTGAGAMPRLDLGVLQAAMDVVAPAPAPARTPAPIAAAPVAAPEPAPAAPPPALPAPPMLALAAATAAAAAAPAAAGALWERLRNASGLLALLYSRIAKERLLDHGSRERLLDAIRAKPGLAVADLADAVAMPRNTVTYHLRVLEREGLVSSTRNGRNRLFFAPGALPQRANADGFAALRHETTLAMARAIGAEPGVDQKALCERVGLSPSLAHWHADRLVASGLVDKRREGRFVRYYPGASFGIVQARSA